MACNALLNTVLQQSTLREKDCVFVPFLVIMGFEMKLSVVFLKSNSFYVVKKIKAIAFLTSLDNFVKEATSLLNGLLELVPLCGATKRQAFIGSKRKSMDDIVNSASDERREIGVTNVVCNDDFDFDFGDEDEDANSKQFSRDHFGQVDGIFLQTCLLSSMNVFRVPFGWMIGFPFSTLSKPALSENVAH